LFHPIHVLLAYIDSYNTIFLFELSETLDGQTKEVTRPRLDTGSDIFDQLTAVFDELSVSSSPAKPEPPIDPITADEEMTTVQTNQSIGEFKTALGKRNVAHLLGLGGADTLLEVCSNLTFLGRYSQRCKEAVAGTSFVMPNTLSEALTSRNR